MQATPTRLIDFVGWHRDTDKNGNPWPENEADRFIQECVLDDVGRHCDDRAGSKEDNQNFYRGNCQIGRVRVAKWVAVKPQAKQELAYTTMEGGEWMPAPAPSGAFAVLYTDGTIKDAVLRRKGVEAEPLSMDAVGKIEASMEYKRAVAFAHH